ncbi:DUF2809 domain-containing protein [Microbacterium sp. NPDC091313]
MTRRIAAFVALALLVGAGLGVHRFLAGSVVADVAGDALYACAAYSGLVLLAPRARRGAPAAIALTWCVAVEMLQLSGLPAQWATEVPVVRFVLGTGFDARDLVVYAAAVAVIWATDAAFSRLPAARRPRTMEG